MGAEKKAPWLAGKNQDAVFYLLIAVFFIEMIVGGVAFFYGIIHARPESAGGPPVARFPWLYWALAAFTAPAAFLLIVHITGSLLSKSLEGDHPPSEDVPKGLARFYASIRHAPAVVLLLGALLLGASLFFIDGAFSLLGRFFESLAPYLPWICGSLAAFLAVFITARAVFIYKHRKMEFEYAWRREVLEKTGMIITDKSALPIPAKTIKNQALPPAPSSVPPEGPLVLEARTSQPGHGKGDDEPE